jgi:hypothetical protein
VTGALLQAQLAARLGPSARENVQALPESFRPWVLNGFEKAAASAKGLEVGAGQSGAHLPADLPSSVRPAIEQVALKTFYEAYVPAMRTTLIVPIAVLVLAVILSLLVRRTDSRVDAQPVADRSAFREPVAGPSEAGGSPTTAGDRS